MKVALMFFWIAIDACCQIDFRTIATWGDSLTAGGYPRILSELSGMKVENGGVNGQTSSQIASRMLAATNFHRYPTILWVGRNNYDQPQTVIRDVDSMVEALAQVGNTNRFLVLGVINSSYGGYENRETLPYKLILQLNQQLNERFKERYVPIREILVEAYDPKQAADIVDHMNDVPPSSLRSDALHLNESGYRLLAEWLLLNKMKQLRGDWGWDEQISFQIQDAGPALTTQVRLGWKYQLEFSTNLTQWFSKFQPIWPSRASVEWGAVVLENPHCFYRLRRLLD